MGHNPTKNPFRRARLGVDDGTQAAVDEYKARSVWGAWWKLSETTRRRFFTKDERDFITRYGARLDEIASFRTNPGTDAEAHFLKVCVGEAEPATDRERLWLFVQLVCRYHRSVERAARADLAEHDLAAALAQNRSLKAKADHLEAYLATLTRDFRMATGDMHPGHGNVQWASPRFRGADVGQPPAMRFAITKETRGGPVGHLTAAGIR